MNPAQRERAARADREILLANLAAAHDEPTRLVIEQLLLKSLFYIRGLMVTQGMAPCSVPDCLKEASETRNGKQWWLGTRPTSRSMKALRQLQCEGGAQEETVFSNCGCERHGENTRNREFRSSLRIVCR